MGETNNIPSIRFEGFTEAWEQRKLEDLCSIITKQTGFDYSATIKPALVTEKRDDTYPFIQNKDFDGENINLDTDFYIPIKVAELFPKITLDTPSLLISISGKIGNVGYYRLKNKAFIGGAVGICKLKKDIGSMLVYALQSESGQAYFHSLIKASSHANITVEDIRNITITLPNSDNECEMVAAYFSKLDNLITLHQRKQIYYKNGGMLMLNEKSGNQLFSEYYKEWIDVYKKGAIRKATMDKYLMTHKWVEKLVPELKVSDMNRTAYQQLLNDYASFHERQTTLDFHHQLKGAIMDAVDEGLIERDPTRKAIIKGKTPKAKKIKYLNQFELHTLLKNLELKDEVNCCLAH